MGELPNTPEPAFTPHLAALTSGAAADILAAGLSDGRLRHTRVVHDEPASVLLVDLEAGAVLHANPAALAIADVPLPATSAQWSAAAGLSPPGEQAYAPGCSPLDVALAGGTVPGQAVVVLRAGLRRPMWVTAFPLPLEGRRLALLMFLDLETDLPEAQIRDRAVVAAGLAFTITDPRRPDNPLVYVNPAFERNTGYPAAEVLGRNCRFLQCDETDPATVQRIRDAIAARQQVTVTVLNQRQDGTRFWNELALSPVLDAEGAVSHFVGIQTDVTTRVHIEEQRQRTLAAEQAARSAAEQAQRRLALLAEATSMLAATLEVDESLRRLTQLVVPLMADWCTVHLLSRDKEVQQSASTHADPGKRHLLDRLEALQPTGLSTRAATVSVLHGGPPVLVEHITEADLLERIDDPDLVETYRQLGSSSAVVVPLRARDHVLGALTLMNGPGRAAFDEDDLAMAADLARRAALTVDNARLYQREHDVAEALQRSLLPQLAHVDGLDVGFTYLPSSAAAQVGGDWYDLFPLPDGTVGVAVGDVMGHDLTAAAAMGQLRSVLRSYAWQGDGPALVLDHLDQLVQGLQMAQLATAVYGRLTLPTADEAGRLVLANAGHLPPVLREADGTTRLLDGVQSLLVGAALGIERSELTVPITAGAMLVLYTDGLIERRGLDPDAGLAKLRSAVAAVDTSRGAQAVVDSLVHTLDGTRRDDDVALLVVLVDP